MGRWTCDACSAWADDLWGACPACRELRPVGVGGPAGPVATSWGETRPGAGEALFAAHLEEAYRVGTLLVTYHRRVAGDAAQG